MLDELRALDRRLAPDGFTTESFIAIDEELATSIQFFPSDEELLLHFTIESTSTVYLVLTPSSCKKQSMIPSFCKTCVTE